MADSTNNQAHPVQKHLRQLSIYLIRICQARLCTHAKAIKAMVDLPNNQACPVLKLLAAKYVYNTHIPSTAMYTCKSYKSYGRLAK